MRSSELHLEQYDSDKIALGYLQRYDPVLEPWLGKEIVLLELGVYKGGSLLLWHDYFPLGTIVGIDINLPKEFKPPERIHIYKGNQADPAFLSNVANEIAPDGFDIIVDDAAHIGELSKTSFWHLFDNHLRPNGLYVIEDWGTGYWDDWADGKSLDLESYFQPPPEINSIWLKIAKKLRLNIDKTPMPGHSYGMVGFIKQLVDEQGAYDVTRRELKGIPIRKSKIESLLITPSIVFVRKADHRANID